MIKKKKARKRNKKATDSFSGIPAIVLGNKEGKIDKKKEETNAIKFAFLIPIISENITLVIKKNAIVVRTKKKAG